MSRRHAEWARSDEPAFAQRGDVTVVLAGVALPIGENGHVKVRYASGLDLLRQTPKFVFDMRAKRLDGEFNRAYRYLEILYGGRNPYMESIDRNL